MARVRCDECNTLIDCEADPACIISFADQEAIRTEYGDIALCEECRAAKLEAA